MKPREIKKVSGGLEILWSDAQRSFAPFSELRKSCTCAICKESKAPLSEALPYFQRAISLSGMNIVGNYAVEIQWADGHRSIVSFDRLRAIQAAA